MSQSATSLGSRINKAASTAMPYSCLGSRLNRPHYVRPSLMASLTSRVLHDIAHKLQPFADLSDEWHSVPSSYYDGDNKFLF